MNIDLVLDIREKNFVAESLCFFGVLLQNNLNNTIKESLTKDHYIKITEGFITTPEIYNEVRKEPNITVLKNNKKIIEKITDETKDVKVIDKDVWIFDLYDKLEKSKLYSIIYDWEKNKKIYLQNTEILPRVDKCNSIAGVASGNGLAQLAYTATARQVTFFDYNKTALEFQKDLINEKDRKEVVYHYRNFLTLGRPIHIGELEINKINFRMLDKYYDNLQTCNVNFLQVDFREKDDIKKLFSFLDSNTKLWLSNVLHYSTNIFTYDPMLYTFIDNLARRNNIDIFPFTRVYYEGKSNSRSK